MECAQKSLQLLSMLQLLLYILRRIATNDAPSTLMTCFGTDAGLVQPVLPVVNVVSVTRWIALNVLGDDRVFEGRRGNTHTSA
jgi:hypothetical protein